MRDIGKNIRELRTRRNMSQDDLAEALFVTRQTVSNYETGKSRPDVEMLVKIAEVLESDVNAILYGPKIPEREKSRRQNQMKKLLTVGCVLLPLIIALWILTPIGKYLRSNLYYVGPYVALKLILKPVVFFLAGWEAIHGVMMLNFSRTEFPWGRYVRIGILAVIGIYALWNVPFTLWSLLPSALSGNEFPPVYIPVYTELLWPMYTLGAEHSYFFLVLGAAWRFFKSAAKKQVNLPEAEENGE